MRSFEKRKPLTDLSNAPSFSGSSATAGDFTNIGKPNHDIHAFTRGKSKMQVENTAQKRTFSVPHQKSAKKQRRKTSKNMDEQVSLLPKDYVEQQRAYFAEIDAFELPEEEVSTSDLE
ncbi:hypothetical protein IHE45_07G104400 [Dioscorea alata]|uniref:Uncharacterized protein n=1 Tax=Dioscorea alata TaxID=55571 RepID=A0ACB7VT44_DIOAL|nr:hypothetical protein IHE45_07G104400 [Dioscorea alata]